MIKNLTKRLICQATAKGDLVSLSNLAKEAAKKAEKEQFELERTGSDLVISNQSKKSISEAAVLKSFNLDYISDTSHLYKALKNPSKSSLFLKYLINMNLAREYSDILREFLQALARQDEHTLDLVAEPNLVDVVTKNLDELRKNGYIIELEHLKIENNISQVLDWRIYKNLRIRREDNPTSLESYNKNKALYDSSINSNNYASIDNSGMNEYAKSSMKDNVDINTDKNKAPAMKFDRLFGDKLIIGRHIGEDKSFFDNNKPIILSSILKIKTPMKLVIYNQNYSKKIFGKNENDDMEYVIKYETELSYSDMCWITPTVNKNSRLRQTRIVDFNNVLNGNNFPGLEDINKNI